MNFLLRVWAIFLIAIKRLYAQRSLALATLLGLIVTIALALSVPLYADAVYFRVLQEELAEEATTASGVARSPFAFMYRYIGAWNGLVSLEDIQQVDEYVSAQAASRLGLPQEFFVRYFKTDNFRLFPSEDVAYADTKDPLAWVNFGFVTDIQDQITIIEGSFPAEAEASPDSTVDVLISEALATELGLQVGETFMTFHRQQQPEGIQRTVQVPIRVVGVWQATDRTNPFWFYTPETLEELLLVSEETFYNRIGPYMDDEVALALWYMVMDGSEVTSSDAVPLLRRINTTQQRVSALLPGTSLDVSPAEALQRYQRGVSLLTVLLYAFSVPILALILIFISLVVGLSVGRQRNEIAVLRSRGATTSQVIGISVLEGVLMGLIALIIGLPVGEIVAQLIGQTESFLNFSGQNELRVSVTAATLRFGFVAVGLALAAQIMPTLGAARHTIVSYKQTQARSQQSPWWQRIWLDVLLLIPAGYGTYLLQQQGSIVSPVAEEVANSSPFQNPLLLLVPALGILSVTLLFLRFLPFIMMIIAWIVSHFGGVGMLLATRQLSRTPGFYAAPMVLLVLTLSLSAFTASLAQTLDNHLFDQAYYGVGADMSVVDFGQASEGGSGTPFGGGSQGGDDGGVSQVSTTGEDTGPRWYFLPVTEYLKAPGVLDATRVGEYGASTRLSGGSQTGTFVGVDRVNFPEIAYWRWDFAPSYLGEMMNALAIAPDGVLMPRTFIRQHALTVGDTIQVNVNVTGQRVEMQMKVMGGFDLFPSWYPEEDGPLFVGNLDYLFEQAGGQYPYNVWLKTTPEINADHIIDEARNLQLRILDSDVAGHSILEERKNPQRQGLFGLLSVGFGAAALLTVLGFLLYALFSFRQRFIELGVLRAIGLSSGQMTIFLAWELAFLILTGVLLGTSLGIWSSQLYIPYLQVGADEAALTPPFLVEIAWPAIIRIYMLFSFLFIVALGVLATLLLRMKIFQAVKLGETV